MSRLARLVSGCDLESLPLTPAEAFLLSRVDAITSETDLALMTGIPSERVAAMLDHLASLGAIELVGGSSPPRATGPRPRSTPPTDPDALSARRRTFARRLFGTQSTATPATPPRRTTEPDPDEVRRAALALHAHRERAITEARRAEVTRLLDEGASALARGDHAAAIDAHRRAASLAPGDPAVQATCEEAIQRASVALADVHWAQAVADERDDRWEEAALGFARVAAARPGDARAHERVANAALRAGNVRRAVEYARRAIDLSPGAALYRVTLARAYVAAGFEASARGELERALELGPGDVRIRNLVSRLSAFLDRRTGNTG